MAGGIDRLEDGRELHGISGGREEFSYLPDYVAGPNTKSSSQTDECKVRVDDGPCKLAPCGHENLEELFPESGGEGGHRRSEDATAHDEGGEEGEGGEEDNPRPAGHGTGPLREACSQEATADKDGAPDGHGRSYQFLIVSRDGGGEGHKGSRKTKFVRSIKDERFSRLLVLPEAHLLLVWTHA